MNLTSKRTQYILGILLVLVFAFSAYRIEIAKADSNSTARAYDTTGAELLTYHMVMGSTTLVAGSKTITLSGAASFTNSSSYSCYVTDSTGLNLVGITYASGSQFTILGVGIDTVRFACFGN